MSIDEKSWVETGLRAVFEARRSACKKGHRAGARWLIECRDLWDFDKMSEDAGVYHVFAGTEADVDALIAKYADDEDNKIDGIFDLSLSLDEYFDISPDDWKAGVRTPRRRDADE